MNRTKMTNEDHVKAVIEKSLIILNSDCITIDRVKRVLKSSISCEENSYFMSAFTRVEKINMLGIIVNELETESGIEF